MDDEAIVRSVGAILIRFRCEVGFAQDGQEVVKIYRRSVAAEAPFDGVILDLAVPGGMGGKEAIKHLGRINPDIRAIVSSGYSNDPVMTNFREQGFADVATKPFNLARLKQAVYGSG